MFDVEIGIQRERCLEENTESVGTGKNCLKDALQGKKTHEAGTWRILEMMVHPFSLTNGGTFEESLSSVIEKASAFIADTLGKGHDLCKTKADACCSKV